MKNSGDSVFDPQPPGDGEAALIDRFLTDNDFSANTRRAFAQDLTSSPTGLCRRTRNPSASAG